MPSALGVEAGKEKAKMPAVQALEENSVLRYPRSFLSFSFTSHEPHIALLKQVYFHYGYHYNLSITSKLMTKLL